MNVELEPLPHCLATLRVGVPPEAVQAARDDIARNFAAQAKLPGYRPGKAPRAVVEKRFQKEIQEELERKLLGDSTRAAIAEKKLRVLEVQNVEDIEFAPDHSLSFTATVVTAPEFDLPEYKGIPVTVPSAEISDPEIDAGVENLRGQAATFEDITGRTLAMEDYAVIDYDGAIDGKPVAELHPKAGKPLTTNRSFWVRLTPESFLPGFCEALVGAALDETREFDITVPSDFALPEMAGVKIHYTVAVRGLKSKKLPEVNDAFAATVMEGKSLAELRDLVKRELGRQKKDHIDSQTREQVMKHLLARVECELPQNYVAGETRRILADIVQQEQARGVTEESLKAGEKELVEAASRGAKDKLKGTFILRRIAEAEKITVSQTELRARIASMAARYGMTPDKLTKELEKRDAIDRVAEDVLCGKVIEWLVHHADIKQA